MTLGRRGLIAGGLAAAAATHRASARPPGGKDLGACNLRLCWVTNAEFAGEYLADHRGYYRDEGFTSARLISGGPSAPPTEIDLVQQRCLLGISAIDTTAGAIAQGAALRTIGAQYQESAYCIVSLASRPILQPQAMIGRTIGVQATNRLVFSSFLALNGLDPDRIRTVPVQFDPTPLISGEVDGWFGFITNEPILLHTRGIATAAMMFADHHYPMVMQTYVARTSTIERERETLKAALRAEIRGWRDNLADPAAGAKLAIEVYGRTLGLDPTQQQLQSKAENALMRGAGTARQGLFRVEDQRIADNVKLLRAGGLAVTASDLFDMSLLDEIYRQDPSLLALPA